MAEPLLTILIPTYNRAAFLSDQLGRLIPMLAKEPTEVEVLVGNNASIAATSKVVEIYRKQAPQIRSIDHPALIPTAEGNLLATLAHARGTYVWPLSDDDLPNPDCLDTLLRTLEREQPGLLLMNLQVVDPEGTVLCPGYFETRTERFRFKGMVDLVRNLGVQDLPACFSAVCWERRAVQAVDWNAYSATSPIYPHVMVYLEAFRDRPCVLLSQPMLSYLYVHGQDATSIGGVMVSNDLPTCFPWAFGILRLLGEAARRGAVPPDFPGEVVELVLRKDAWEVTPRPLCKSIALYLANHVRRCLMAPSAREWLTSGYWDEARCGLACLPRAADFVDRLQAFSSHHQQVWMEGGTPSNADVDKARAFWHDAASWPDRFDPVSPLDPRAVHLPGHNRRYFLRASEAHGRTTERAPAASPLTMACPGSGLAQ